MNMLTASEHPVTETGFNTYRTQLGQYAWKQLDPALRGKLDLSGVVQQTLLDASVATSPDDPKEIGYWLKAILNRNLNDEMRRVKAHKRDVRRERAIVDHFPGPSVLSPSQNAIMAENIVLIATVISKLPVDQQDVIKMRYFQELGLEEIAEKVGKTKASIAGLLRRGIATLRELLNSSNVTYGS